METMWTIDRVKAELPNVEVRTNDGRIVSAMLRGRTLPFAVVHTAYDESFEVAWETVAHCLNSHKPIIE